MYNAPLFQEATPSKCHTLVRMKIKKGVDEKLINYVIGLNPCMYVALEQ